MAVCWSKYGLSSFLSCRFLLSPWDIERFLVCSGSVWAAGAVWLHAGVHRAPHARQPQSVSPQCGELQRPLSNRQETGALLRLHAHQEALLQAQARGLCVDTLTYTQTHIHIRFWFIFQLKAMIQQEREVQGNSYVVYKSSLGLQKWCSCSDADSWEVCFLNTLLRNQWAWTVIAGNMELYQGTNKTSESYVREYCVGKPMEIEGYLIKTREQIWVAANTESITRNNNKNKTIKMVHYLRLPWTMSS